MDYIDIYRKRLNRYGTDYLSRVQTQREQLFESYLLKTVYRVDFEYNGKVHPGSLERYKQDETQTLQYLLTRLDLKLPSGTILEIMSSDGTINRWMIYYLQTIEASGYNKYIVLKMTHFLKWKNRKGEKCSTWAYMYGQEDNMLKDEIKSRSRMDTLYTENLKMSFFVTPMNKNIRKDDYFEVGEEDFIEAYRVTGYDINSTPGVEYVTVDPVLIRDHSPVPINQDNEDKAEFFWINGGE